jgi:hypothetical protein
MSNEPRINLVDGIRLCDLCLDGAGGECHTPGCVMFINRAPDIPLRDTIVQCGGTITPEVPYSDAAAVAAFTSYVKHFSDPLQAAEQDLLGEALRLIRHLCDRCDECHGTGSNMLCEDVECSRCTESREFLTKTKGNE